MKLSYIFAVGLLFAGFHSFGQGVIQQSLSSDPSTPMVGCGSHELLLKMDDLDAGLLKKSNDFLIKVRDDIKQNSLRSNHQVYRIPVVFHVLYNNANEDIPDTVLIQQIEVLNAAFRRTNGDTVNMRPEFQPVVGDSKIEFFLATTDPSGNATNGIIHKPTAVANFGGILPYAASQQTQIAQWVNDSLFYNFFRMTKDSLGGSDAWDTTKYLNIWIGDLTIFEPQINNTEELVFFGLSTPPVTHPIWPAATMQQLAGLGDGTLMHYKAMGPNNPEQFVAPYAYYNGRANTGKMLVHEVGHYLGLRHIWGDGPCAEDDFVDDTPRASAASQYNCNTNLNTCLDTIVGVNLPNMVENYMDYSEGDCQNSFTTGQVEVMRATLENFRVDLTITSIQENSFSAGDIKLFPNPTSNNISLEFNEILSNCTIDVMNITGVLISHENAINVQNITVELPATSGIYFVRVNSGSKMMTFKVVKR